MDDTFVDFNALVRAADISKMNAVRALQDLYMRMDAADSQTSKDMLTLPSPPATPGQSWEFQTHPPPTGCSFTSNHTLIPPKLSTSSPGEQNYCAGPPQPRGPPSPPPPREQQSSPRPPPRAEPRRSDASNIQSSSRQTTLVDDSTPELWSRRSSDSKSARRSSFFGLIKRRSCQSETSSTLPKESTHLPGRDSMGSPPSSVSVQALQAHYNGYCKGAYFLQIGLKKESMKLRNQPSGITGQSYFWACCSSKCCFEGPAVQMSRTWEFEEHIWTASGVRFRWSFLAKSHVPIKKTKGKLFDYKCLFCEAQKKSSVVYKGIREFMAHVAEHNGDSWEEASVHNFKLISGREAGADEIFDINFTAPPSLVPATLGSKMEDSTLSKSDNPPVWALDEKVIFGAEMWR